jgi:hypothetical protein
MREKSNIVDERPIATAEQDLLGYAPHAERMAKSILNLRSSPYVIHLNAPWGAGKTSFINLLRNNVKRKAIFLELRPWEVLNYFDKKGHDHFSDYFFSEIRGKLPFWRLLFKSELKKRENWLEEFLPSKFQLPKIILRVLGLSLAGFCVFKFLQISYPWDFSPHFLNFHDTFIQTFDWLNKADFKTLFTLWKPEESFDKIISTRNYLSYIFLVFVISASLLFAVYDCGTLSERKEAVEKHFRKFRKKIIVVLDDLDRLEAEELLDVFRLIKAVGDFSNIIYVLSFHKKSVSSTLEKHLSFESGDQYLEKFIQYSFDLPPVYGEQLLGLFEKKLSDQKVFIDKIDLKERWEVGSAREYLRKRLNSCTIRSVNRLANKIGFDYPAVQGHVDVIDFIVLSFMRDYDPEVFWFLEKYERALTLIDKILPDREEDQSSLFSAFVDQNPSLKGKYNKPLEDVFKYLTTGQHVNSFSRKSAAYFEYLPPSYSIERSTLEELVEPETLKNKDEFKSKFQNLCDQYTIQTVGRELNPIVKPFVEPSNIYEKPDEERRLDYYNCLLYSFKEAKFNFDDFFVGSFCHEWMPSVLEKIQLETKTQGLWMYLDWCRMFSKNNKIALSETKIKEIKGLIRQSTDHLPDDYRFISYIIPWFFDTYEVNKRETKLVNDILEQKKESIIEAIKRNHNFNLPFQIKSDSVATSFFKTLKQKNDSLEIIFRD